MQLPRLKQAPNEEFRPGHSRHTESEKSGAKPVLQVIFGSTTAESVKGQKPGAVMVKVAVPRARRALVTRFSPVVGLIKVVVGSSGMLPVMVARVRKVGTEEPMVNWISVLVTRSGSVLLNELITW